MTEMNEKCMKDNIHIKKIDNNNNYEIDRDLFNREQKIYNINENKIQFDEQKSYYAVQDKKSQCNNNIEQWHRWFTIPYYYLGNNNGRYNELSNNEITYSIVGGCFNQCIDNYIINEEFKCENKNTFKGGKYKKFLPYDPFAIICLIGSVDGIISDDKYNIIKIKDHVYNIITPGNYHYTIDNLLNDDNIILKSNDMLVVNNEIKNLILNDIKDQSYGYDPTHKILSKINKDILAAHSKIIEYVNYIIKENEEDLDKIEKNIKKDINKFYNLFDKRDELYIKYLNNFTTEKKRYNLLYAKSLAVYGINGLKYSDPLSACVLVYLFEYCSYLCFNKKSIYCERLKLYGIYKDLDKDIDLKKIDLKKLDDIFQDKLLRSILKIKEEEVLKIPSPTQGIDIEGNKISPPLKISYAGGNDYKPIQVKLENKQFLIFEDYEKILNLYKSFLVVYPVLFTITISIFIFLVGLYIIDSTFDLWGTYLIRRKINYLYSFVLWLNYILKWFSFNFIFTYIIRSFIWFFNSKIISDKLRAIYEWIISKISITPIIAVILLIIILILIFTVSLNSIFMIIPSTIEFILRIIGYIILFMFGLLIYLSRLDNLLLICLVIYILYLYYHIIYKFKYSYFADKLKGDDNTSLFTENADLLDGAFLIAELNNNEDAEQILFERNKIINYAFLLDTYMYAHNVLNKLLNKKE
jgi:hypothetical protein